MTKAQIIAEPHKALFDEAIVIQVKNLAPHQHVTLQSSVKERNAVFQCFVHYEATIDGEVNLTNQPAVGGMYRGIESMGLFWGMEASKVLNKRRVVVFSKTDVSTPCIVTVRLYNGHHNDENVIYKTKVLAEVRVERWFKSDTVRRFPVKHGRIRGVMFVPDGPGPFPGIVDLRGSVGGCSEYRPALLASHGFVTLTMAYSRYQDLPKMLTDVEIEYFEEGVDYLLSQPNVLKKGVGALGNSTGGMAVQALLSYVPKVLCAVSINGSHYALFFNVFYKHRIWKMLESDISKAHLENDAIVLREAHTLPKDIKDNVDSTFDIHRSKGALMLIAGEDDEMNDNPAIVDHARKLMDSAGKKNYTILLYPGAGHFIEPPFSPFCPKVFHPFGKVLACGGMKVRHARANADSWKQYREFFLKHLCTAQSSL